MASIRTRIQVQGIVQGVGFRPFVHQLARRLGLGGFIQNNSYGVEIEVEGGGEAVGDFLRGLREETPPLARVTGIESSPLNTLGQSDFTIRASEALAGRTALISPDVAVCDDCLAEMFDPSDRRYRYPFINCTNCGPRYTIITDVPYDRDKTSMRVFEMCPACAAEYGDPADRRFHAQPNACPVCGPRVTLLDGAGHPIPLDDPIAGAVEALHKGLVLAVKGLGGFHLAADAADADAVRRLRSHKHREEKPLAVMSTDMESIRTYARTTPEEETVLASIQRPIVLLRARTPSPLAPNVAPDNRYIGAMLAYTPLHHLLLRDFPALVMTSGNLTDEPIAIDNQEAVTRLDGIADYFLVHDRDIYLRTDDSVVRLDGPRPRQIRRSRGFVPVPVFLRRPQPSILALGGELKNTVCLTKQDRAFVSQHVGDLENLLTLEFFDLTIRHLRRILDIEPAALARDLHPEYLSTKVALSQRELQVIGVQHHHAHVVSAMAELGLAGPVIGLACDGTGYGDDGQIWGGEFLRADEAGYERLGHLDYAVLPGGAAAIKEPWRMALSFLDLAFGREALDLDIPFLDRRNPDQVHFIRQVIAKRVNSPLTSSLGRLFDAVAALIGLRDVAAFEGQAAMMLEMACPEGEFDPYDFDVSEIEGRFVVQPQALIRAMVRDLVDGRAREEISGRFHAAVIRALAETTLRISARTGLTTVVLSGGCFQNQVLTRGLIRALETAGLKALTQHLVPVNDGGLSLGQAVCAGARLIGAGR
ncbi:MAG: carbamoyltransferase HypF [Proteobacteria bacterium]|nr:carbamoyltransferase HypF [Pseudomonadota bacterium]